MGVMRNIGLSAMLWSYVSLGEWSVLVPAGQCPEPDSREAGERVINWRCNLESQDKAS